MILITITSEFFEKNKMQIAVTSSEDAFNTYWVFQEFFKTRHESATMSVVESSGRIVDLRKGITPLRPLIGRTFFDLEKSEVSNVVK